MRPLFLLFAFFLLSATDILGQNAIHENYFAEVAPKVSGEILDYIKTPELLFLRASMPIKDRIPQEYLGAINPDGQILWQSYEGETDSLTYHFGLMTLGDDGFLYVEKQEGSAQYILKISPSNGSLQWRVPVPSDFELKGIQKRSLAEITLKLLNKNTNLYEIFFISTQNGGINTQFPTLHADLGLFVTDSTGFYYTFSDSIVRTNPGDLTQVLWRKRIKSPWGAVTIKNMSQLVFSADKQSMIVFGSSNDEKVSSARISTVTGDVSNVLLSQVRENVRELLVKGDTIFSCQERLHQTGVSQGSYSVMATLFSTGARAYQGLYTVDQPGTGTPLNGLPYSLSMAMDTHGYIYLCGFTSDNSSYDNFGTWGIVKARSSDGAEIWTKILDETPTGSGFDRFSAGKVLWYPANQKFWMLGEIQTIDWGRGPLMLEMDLSNFTAVSHRYLAGNYNYGSSLLQFLCDDNEKYFALKQVDNTAQVSAYDLNEQEQWTFKVGGYQYFKPSALYKSKGNSLMLLGVSKAEYGGFGSLGGNFDADSVHLFKLDASNGELLQHWTFNVDLGISFGPVASVLSDTLTVIFGEDSYPRYAKIIDNQAGPIKDIGSSVYLFSQPDVDPRFRFHEWGRKSFLAYSDGGQVSITSSSQELWSIPFNLFQFKSSGLSHVPNSYHIIAGGEDLNNAGKWGLCRYVNATTPAPAPLIWQKSGTTGKIRLVKPGNGDLLFTGGVSGSNLYLKRFSLASGLMKWEKTINVIQGTAKINDIAFDSISNQLIVGGSINKANGEQSLWLIKMDTSGNMLSQIIRAETPGTHNQINSIQPLPSGRTLVGGTVDRPDTKPSGFIWSLPGHFNTGTGKVFVDMNDNAQIDSTEFPYRQTVSITPGNYFSFPDSSGTYISSVLTDGLYQADLQNPSPYFDVKPANLLFDPAHSTVQGADIRLVPNADVLDANLKLLEIGPARFSTRTSFLLNIKNNGTRTIDSADVKINCDADITMKQLYSVSGSSSIKHQMSLGNTLQGRLTGMAPLGENLLRVNGILEATLLLGDTLVCSGEVKVFPELESILGNNTDTIRLLVVGSYDPNDVTAYPGGEIVSSKLNNDGSLDLMYRIRFQNTGNAPTNFIRVENQYSPLLRPETFRLEAVSSPCKVRFLEGQKIEFQFDHYELPPAKIDSLNSEGYIFYSVKSRTGLAPGDTLFNSAEIYFDYNPAIETNKALTYLSAGSGLQDLNADRGDFFLSPNPCAGGSLVRIFGDFQEETAWTLFDEHGRHAGHGSLSEGINTRGLSTGMYQVHCAGKTKGLLIVK